MDRSCNGEKKMILADCQSMESGFLSSQSALLIIVPLSTNGVRLLFLGNTTLASYEYP